MADILIRMEMPENCFNCSTKIDPDNRRCNIDGHVFEETLSKLTCRRDENCPLHELPEHGDLIDRDALKHKFCTHCDGYEYDTGACVDGDQDCMDAKIIMTAPVIVPSNKEEEIK